MADDDLPPSLREELPPSLRNAPSFSRTGPPSLQEPVSPLGFAIGEMFKRIPPVRVLHGLRRAEQLSRRGLKQLASFVPEPDTNSAVANIVLGTPRVAAETVSEFAPGFISPEAAVLSVAGPAAKAIATTPGVRRAATAIGEALPPSLRKFGQFIKRAFTTRIFGADPVAERLAERVGTTIASGEEKAAEVGKMLLEGLSRPERLRLGQIVRGGISVSPKELPLRLRASMARQVVDDLEDQAMRLKLIPEEALGRLTKASLARIRNQQTKIQERINRLNTFQARQVDALESKAQKLSIGGARGLARRIDNLERPLSRLEEMIPEAKEIMTGQEFEHLENLLSQSSLRRNQTVQRLLTRFSTSDMATQERLMEKLLTVAKRAGLAVDQIWNSPLSITNFQGLLNRIQNLPTRFPGQQALVRGLQSKSQQLQEKLVDSYTQSGQRYMPRLFMSKEFMKEKPQGFSFSPLRISRDRFFKRDHLTDEIRKAMGEILEPAFPIATGIKQVTHSLALTRFFNRLKANPKWAVPKTSQNAPADFVPLPETPRLGVLSGHLVHPEIGRDLLQMIRAPSSAEKLWDNFISKWKFGKVVLNPSTHFRNLMSNTILMDLAGISQTEQPRLLLQAVREIRNRGENFRRAKALGLFGKEFVGGEIKVFHDSLLKNLDNPDLLDRMGKFSKAAAQSFGNAYQNEEQLFKLAAFIANRETGMKARQAAKLAQKWIFDYTKVSPVVGYLRKAPFGSPFITFTAKAIPRIAETLVSNPFRLYKYQLLFDAIEQVGIDRGVFTTEERDVIKRNARGQTVILPSRDPNNNPYVLDLTYIMPWGDIGERGGLFGLPPVSPPSGPLRAVIEAGLNRNAFTGKPIYLDTDTFHEKAAKVSDFLGKTLLPSLTPGVDVRGSPFRGGFSFQKLNSAILKKPDFLGRVRTLPNVAADVFFGFKARPTSADEQFFFETRKMERSLEDLETELKKVLRHPGVSFREKVREEKLFGEKVERLIQRPQTSRLKRLREKVGELLTP